MCQTGVFSLLLHGFNGRYWVALSCLRCVSHDAFQQLHWAFDPDVLKWRSENSLKSLICSSNAPNIFPFLTASSESHGWNEHNKIVTLLWACVVSHVCILKCWRLWPHMCLVHNKQNKWPFKYCSCALSHNHVSEWAKSPQTPLLLSPCSCRSSITRTISIY